MELHPVGNQQNIQKYLFIKIVFSVPKRSRKTTEHIYNNKIATIDSKNTKCIKLLRIMHYFQCKSRSMQTLSRQTWHIRTDLSTDATEQLATLQNRTISTVLEQIYNKRSDLISCAKYCSWYDEIIITLEIIQSR